MTALVLSLVLAADPVVFATSARRTAEVEEDVAWAVNAVPAALRPTAQRPLRIEFDDASGDFGLGPIDGTRVTFTAWREPDDPRALAPLAGLSRDQRERLWRRRGVVHALVRRIDERLRWSARPGWRALSGWEGDRPFLIYSWAFSRRAGQESAALDLATFAEELLVPPESLAPETVAPDEHVRCRLPSKAHFFDARLASVDSTWNPPRSCPALDAWTTPEDPPRFEVLFSAPSSHSAQAMAGHVLLRIVRADDGPDEGQVLQLAALISPVEPPTSYLARGLAGGFQGVFSISSLADVRHEALGLEQRSLRRFELTLSRDERVRLMRRVWELERVGYVAYAFFKANCATMLRFVLAPVLGVDGPQPTPTPWEAPTQVLEGLAPRLAKVETDEASVEAAERAWERREQLLSLSPRGRGLGRGQTAPAPEGSPLTPTLSPGGERELLDKAATRARRIAAYQSLALPGPSDLEPWRAQVLLASLRIERAQLDVATVARLKTERRAILPGWKGPTTDDLLRARQQRFEQKLAPRERAEAELSELLALDALLREAPRRPLTAADEQAFSEERAARDVFEAVAAAVAELPGELLDAALDAERLEREHEQAAWAARAVPEGGHGYGLISAGVSESLTPTLRLRAAALNEQLGDQRLRGFSSRAAWRLVDVALELEPRAQPVRRSDVTLLDVRAVAADGWGAGGGLTWSFFNAAHEVNAHGAGLRVLAADRRLINLLLLDAGASLGVRTEPSARFLLVPRIGLSTRLQLPGSFGNAVRLDGAYVPRLRAGNGLDLEHGASAAASVQLRLGRVAGLAFTARAEARGEWRPSSGLVGLASLGLELD